MTTQITKIAKSENEKKQLDELLWKILWKPLGFPRDTRAKFGLPGKEIELIVIEGRTVIAGLVAIWTAQNELEIRHLAVEQGRQHRSIGSELISSLFNLIKKDKSVKVRAYARNTSLAFFEKLGFEKISGKWIEHPDFEKHNIRFAPVEKTV